MNIRELIKSDIEKSIISAGLSPIKPVEITYPSHPNFGDYTTNWPISVSRDLQQSPDITAKKIQENLPKSEAYDSPELAERGLLNFKLKPQFLTRHLLLSLAEGKKFGSSSVGKGKTALVEFSSPNIAKPMHIGHLRNTNIGQVISNLHQALGYRTISDNHIGDWGTQFGMLLYAFKVWGKDNPNPSIKNLLDYYIKFNQQAKIKPELEQAARDEFKKLEQGDKENRELWQKFRQASLNDFERIYQQLGVKFDYSLGESFYEKDLPTIVEQALKLGVAKKDPDGSVIIPLEEQGLPPLLILKSDGATLYGTRDLATAKYRIKEFKPNKVLLVVGVEQTLYFRQVFAALKKLGWVDQVEWTHISYGLTSLPEGKMSTRSGDLITAEEIIDQAKKRAKRIIKEKSTDVSEESIKALAIGAIKWNDLKISREAEVVFDWERIFTLEGNSGPYMQYSYSRSASILAKAELSDKTGSARLEVLSEPAEIEIMRLLVRFPEVIEDAAESYSPHLLTNFAYELAQAFGRFYETVPVLHAEQKLRLARLKVVEAVGLTLKTSLNLLGIDAPEHL